MTDAQAMLIAQEGTGPIVNGQLMPYQDNLGFWTIGYGRCIEKKGISQDEAIMMLNNDLGDAIDAVRHNFSCYDQLSRPRQLVLISMGHQLGKIGLSKFSRFIHYVHMGDHDAAANEILDSKAAQQTPVRYQQLAAMWRDNTSSWV